MDQNGKRVSEDDHYDRGRARKRRRITAGVLNPELYLPIPEAGRQKGSADIVDPNGFNADWVFEKRNATRDNDHALGEKSAVSPRDHVEKEASTGGHRCLLGFRIVVLRTPAVSRFLPLLPLRHDQAHIERSPTQTFALDIPPVPSGPSASLQQSRASTGSSEETSLATVGGRNNRRHNAVAPRLDLGRVAFQMEGRIDYSVQSASRLEPKSSALTITDQLPSFELLEGIPGVDVRAIPIFGPTYKVVEPNWKIAFFLGVYLYVDDDSYRRLEESLAPITRRLCRQLTFREVLNMPHLVVYESNGIVKLDFYSQLPPGRYPALKLPSIPTFSVVAFVQQLSIHLTKEQEISVMRYWNQIPPCNPSLPNVDLTRPDRPARPQPLEDGRYKWTNCLQPVRWFMCPCALRHKCKYTGVGIARCAAWTKICTQYICEHGPDTDLVHVGRICGYQWHGRPCRDGPLCRYVHGIAIAVKSIEHQYCHHRNMKIVNQSETA